MSVSRTLRRAGIDDIPLICCLAKELFPSTYREILTPTELDPMLCSAALCAQKKSPEGD